MNLLTRPLDLIYDKPNFPEKPKKKFDMIPEDNNKIEETTQDLLKKDKEKD